MPAGSKGRPTPAGLKRRMALADAVRRERGALSQTELGRLLAGPLGAPVPQTTISRWEGAEVELTLEQVRSLEIALDLPLGSLARAAGYL